MEIYNKLKHKFLHNFDKSINTEPDLLQEAEIKAKFIFSMAGGLSSEANSKTKKEVCQIYNEIFSDLSISIYLTTCSINNPSKVLLRRGLELGIGIIYFWDLPHEFWGWKNIESYETDLSFKNSLEHLGSLSYSEYLKNELGINGWEMDKDKKERINKLYRRLSNTIHGKYNTFETISEKLFDYDPITFKSNLEDIICCENILISCFKARFSAVFADLTIHVPAIERYKYAY